MARPTKSRNICEMPRFTRFGACGACHDDDRAPINMTLDEYETIRLIDHESLTQEECADRMEIARTTVTAIYAEARRKIAEAIVAGHAIEIAGGNVRVCDGSMRQCGQSGCGRRDGCRFRGFSDPSKT
ncbi:MAG: DUF134 domain-containing protein [Candidatus Izemoplasmatales bacterium]